MSTYYFLVCNDCREKTDAASKSAGGIGHLDNSEHTLLPFIVKHHNHNVKVTSEHDYELYDPNYEYKEWTKENIGKLLNG